MKSIKYFFMSFIIHSYICSTEFNVYLPSGTVAASGVMNEESFAKLDKAFEGKSKISAHDFVKIVGCQELCEDPTVNSKRHNVWVCPSTKGIQAWNFSLVISKIDPVISSVFSGCSTDLYRIRIKVLEYFPTIDNEKYPYKLMCELRFDVDYEGSKVNFDLPEEGAKIHPSFGQKPINHVPLSGLEFADGYTFNECHFEIFDWSKTHPDLDAIKLEYKPGSTLDQHSIADMYDQILAGLELYVAITIKSFHAEPYTNERYDDMLGVTLLRRSKFQDLIDLPDGHVLADHEKMKFIQSTGLSNRPEHTTQSHLLLFNALKIRNGTTTSDVIDLIKIKDGFELRVKTCPEFEVIGVYTNQIGHFILHVNDPKAGKLLVYNINMSELEDTVEEYAFGLHDVNDGSSLFDKRVLEQTNLHDLIMYLHDMYLSEKYKEMQDKSAYDMCPLTLEPIHCLSVKRNNEDSISIGTNIYCGDLLRYKESSYLFEGLQKIQSDHGTRIRYHMP